MLGSQPMNPFVRVAKTLPLFAGLFFCLSPNDARAQNYRSVPIGGRTATMGGAGTAAGNDSAMPFLNPAGLASLPGDVFAVSASIYGFQRLNLDRALAPKGFPKELGKVSRDESSSSSTGSFELPSAVMYVKHLSAADSAVRHLLGVSLVIPAATSQDYVTNRAAFFPSTQTNFAMTNAIVEHSTDYYLGPTWAMASGDRLRFGASLFALYNVGLRSTTISSSFLLANGTLPASGATNQTEETKGYGVVAVLGGQLKLVHHLWAGLGLSTPSITLGGSGSISRSQNDVNVDVNAGSSTLLNENTNTQVDVKIRRPLRINAGLAWDNRESFSAAVDIVVHLSQDKAQSFEGVSETQHIETGEAARRYKAPYSKDRNYQTVVDLSAGAEMRVTDVLSIRAGLMTARSNRPKIDKTYGGSQGYSIREDRYGGTLGVGTTFGSFDSTVGLAYIYSDISFPAIDVSKAGNPVIAVDGSGHTLMLVLSGAVTIAEARQTIEKNLPTPAVPVTPLP